MKIFKNRFGRQPLWWHFLNLIRMILSIFFKRFRLPKKKKYKARKDVGPLHPKKYAKRDIRKWSMPILSLALAGLTWLVNYQVTVTPEDLRNSVHYQVDSAPASSNSSNEDTSKEKFVISQFSVEQIENLANTIAGQNAIWPGYKGDEKNHREVQRHFNQQFATWINSGIIPVDERWFGRSVAFAYAVNDDGVLVFVGEIPGGSLTAEKNPYAYQTISEGISGRIQVTPAQNEAGDNIIMVYRIRIKFATQ